MIGEQVLEARRLDAAIKVSTTNIERRMVDECARKKPYGVAVCGRCAAIYARILEAWRNTVLD